MPTHELPAFLLTIASRLSGYPEIAVETLPPVRVLQAAEIADLVCPKDPEHCEGIVATFETERYEILIRDSLNLEDPADNSFLLNESFTCCSGRREATPY